MNTLDIAKEFKVDGLLLFTSKGKGSCSLACDYCFLHKTGVLEKMSYKVLEDSILFLEGLTDTPKLAFFGTEPTMDWDLIVKARDLRPKMPISLTTNGFLLDREKIDWCEKEDVKIYVYSIDGDRHHSLHRKTPNGKESWQIVVDNFKYLLKSQGNWVTARVTLAPDDYDLVGRFKFFDSIGAKSVQVVPSIEKDVTWEEDRFKEAYLGLGEYYNWQYTPSRFINDLLERISKNKPKPGYPCNFGVGLWTVMPDGTLHACQRGEKIGTIYDGITDISPLYESKLCAKIVNSRQPLKKECLDCIAFNYCPGVGYCSDANRLCGNPAIPTDAHCQHLRGMVGACKVWAEKMYFNDEIILKSNVFGGGFNATKKGN